MDRHGFLVSVYPKVSFFPDGALYYSLWILHGKRELDTPPLDQNHGMYFQPCPAQSDELLLVSGVGVGCDTSLNSVGPCASSQCKGPIPLSKRKLPRNSLLNFLTWKSDWLSPRFVLFIAIFWRHSLQNHGYIPVVLLSYHKMSLIMTLKYLMSSLLTCDIDFNLTNGLCR